MLNELALFAGSGGGLLASRLLGFRTVCAVENDPYCQRVLIQRQNDGLFSPFPIWDDIRTFTGGLFRGSIDLITAGFPCQAYSSAASGGNDISRDLWPDTSRVVNEIRPYFVFGENVNKRAIERACKDLRLMDYTCRAVRLSAADMGADHTRRRYWFFAYSNNSRELLLQLNAETSKLSFVQNGIWRDNPRDTRVVNGLANWMDRIRATGNGQVPIVAIKAFQMLVNSAVLLLSV